MLKIELLSPRTAASRLVQLTLLLQDAVDSGASVGFLPPLSHQEASMYWGQIIAELSNGARLLFAAFDGDHIVGTVQLELAAKKNAPHRAEVQKLMVHTQFRNRGIGALLMNAVEAAAREAARSLLILDTRRGDSAERLYTSLGYTVAGIIPQFALSATGEFDDTVLFYKFLP